MTYRLVVVAVESGPLLALPDELGDAVDVQVFQSANDALWELRANPPEAVIADIDLPGMTGLELAEIVPNFELSTRVLLWSARPNADAQKQAEAYGVYRFLTGPTSPGELRSIVEAAMRDARDTATQSPNSVEAEPEPAPEPAKPVVAADTPAPRTERRDFTPARVTLPSVAEREKLAEREKEAAAATPAPRTGLGSRARAAVERKPEPRPTPAPPPSAPARRSASGNLVVTTENIAPIRSIMSQLAQDLGAQSIMLTDRAGMVLVDVGTTDNLPMMIVLPLLSTSFSTAGEISRMMHEDDATTVYIHEGVNYDLYCFDVVQRFLLVLVFNKKVASSKIGAVWVNAKRAIRELRDQIDK
jgi:DNA-binding NarL/FixJ family response regulator